MPLDFSHGMDGRSNDLIMAERAQRSTSLENPSVSLVDPVAWAAIFGEFRSAAGISVDNRAAMSVPAVWCAVTFISGCIAHLPLKLHRKSTNGRETLDTSNMAKMLAGAVNDEHLSSFKWRRQFMTSALLNGRGMTYIERYKAGDGRFLWPLPFQKTTVKRQQGKLSFNYRDGAATKTQHYSAGDVIDISMLDDLDGVGTFNPVETLRDTIGLAIALRRYASRFFQNGGVPPLAMEGPAASPQAVARAKTDTGEAVKQSSRSEDNILYLPTGHKLTPIGFNPEKAQMLDSQRFVVEEVSRIYNLPPSFLHSLLNMPFATVEQQDLNLVKHNIAHWCEQIESELNIKLFGSARGRYVEFDLDALLRGDLVSRMAAYAQAIQSAVYKPNEVRARENLPPGKGGDALYMNGAIVPIDPDDPTSTGAEGGEQDNPGDPEIDPNLPDPPPGPAGANPVDEDDSDVST